MTPWIALGCGIFIGIFLSFWAVYIFVKLKGSIKLSMSYENGDGHNEREA